MTIKPVGLSLVAGGIRGMALQRLLAPAFFGLLFLVVTHPVQGQNTFSVNDVSIVEGAAGTTTLTFTVSRSNAGGNPSVQVATVNGTATTTDNDYVAVTTTTLNFGPAVTSLPVAVTINGDAKVEIDETFTVVLFNPAPASWSIAKATGVGTITNDDTATIVIGAAAAVPEGAPSTTASALFPVDLSAQVDVDVRVDFATEDLQATAPDNDYVSATGSVTFLAGSTTTQMVPVTVNGDAKVEFDQAFQVRLSNVSAQGRSVTIPAPTSVAAATIQNDDLGRIVINDVTQAEGTGGPPPTSFTFNLALLDEVEIPLGATLSVDVGTADGTATVADNDYVTNSGTRSFDGTLGQIQTLVVDVTRDAKVELNETFQANLSNLQLPAPPGMGIPPLNVVISDGAAVGAITNDDSATLSIADTSAFETDTGSTPTFTLTATLSAQVDVPVSVSFATANVTATTGDNDYVATNGTLNFAGNAGETQSVSVTVNGDDKVELDETFLVNLSNIQASSRDVTFADSAGGGTIVNDETATLSIDDVTQAEGGPSGTTTVNFTVTLDRTLATPISVDFDIVDGTATLADSDMEPASGTLNFAGVPNETEIVAVTLNGDSFAELDEVFNIVLSNLQAGGLAVSIAGQGLGTITNDDLMDLAITKDDGGVNSSPSGTIAYQLDYDNLGAQTARGVQISEVVPDDTTFDSAGSSPGWACAPDDSAGSTCTLDVGTVLAGGSGSATFALTVDDLASLSSPPPLNIVNTASISDETGGFADTTAANNSDTDTTLVVESVPTSFFTLDPCRVIDTRNAPGPLGGPALDANADRVFSVAGICGIPPTATAISVNIAVTAASVAGNIRIHPGGTPVPLISSINYSAGQTRSNNAIVVLNANGELAVSAVQASGTVHFILDVNGYFE
jgi:hypothetical protein